MEKLDQEYNNEKEALVDASFMANQKNETFYIYKRNFNDNKFKVTNYRADHFLWTQYLVVYPYEPSEMTIKEKGL